MSSAVCALSMNKSLDPTPFDDECIYIHEESENCKYAQSCERKLCMFKHGDVVDKEDENGEVIVMMMSLSVRE